MEDNIENIEMINVGMVGHIDHGKTTLLSKLTGKFADTHSEELKRGITIKNIIIVQNKIDLVTKEQAQKNFQELKEFVKGTVAENAQIIPVSAQQNINIEKLKELILELPIPKRDTESKPEFIIARSFDINRPGTEIQKLKGGVIAGILKKGKLKVGDEIEIKPGVVEKQANQFFYKTVKTKVTSIYRGTHAIQEATPGGSLAFETELDNILTKKDSLSGNIASTENVLPNITESIKIKYNLFKEVLGASEKIKVEEIKPSEMLMLSVNTTITVGRVQKIKGNEIDLILKIPVVPLKGDNVGIARNIENHWRLIGFGEII